MTTAKAHAFSDDDVVKLASLARIAMDADERARVQGELASILGYIDTLTECDVDGVEPMVHASHGAHALRDDVAQEVLGVRALSGSAGLAGDLVRVPKVIE